MNTEKQFQSIVVAEAKKRGWMVYHTYDARRSAPGFPDLVRDRVLFRELKTEKGRLTSAQKEWQDALIEGGADYSVWRPSMTKDIYKELA